MIGIKEQSESESISFDLPSKPTHRRKSSNSISTTGKNNLQFKLRESRSTCKQSNLFESTDQQRQLRDIIFPLKLISHRTLEKPRNKQLFLTVLSKLPDKKKLRESKGGKGEGIQEIRY